MFDALNGNYLGSPVSFGSTEEGVSGVAVNQSNHMYLVFRSYNQADVKIYSLLSE